MPRLLALGLAMALSGCAVGMETVRPVGGPVGAPAGWLDYCARHPEDPSCPVR